MSNIEIGLDLTKHTKIKKFNEYIKENKSHKNDDIHDNIEVGLNLINDNSGYKIDLTKYGENIN